MILVTWSHNHSGSISLSSLSRPQLYTPLPATDSAARIASNLGSIFEEFAPSNGSEASLPQWKRQNAIFQDRWTGVESEDLWDTIQLNATNLLRVRESHDGFIQAIRKRLPEYIPPSDTGNRRRGIVTVGGGSYFPPLLVSLRLLRRTGTTLPVEIFMPEQEYEADLCETALAALGATCHIFPDIPPLKLATFQFKIFAVLFSSFDEVLLLDADDFPLRDVEPLFSSIPYTSWGMIIWPDFWGTAVSPLYYLVSNQKPIPLSRRPKSETGQLVVNKAQHWHTLLLAAYYNYYPGLYYPMLCQGCIGCGDSETILPAADALGIPYYEVQTPPLHIGHKLKDEAFQGHVIVQFDPRQDFAAASKLFQMGTADNALGFSTFTERARLREHVQPLFMHASFPKWDPSILLDHISQWSDMTRDIHGHPAAAFQDPVEDAWSVKGVERMAWEEATWVACNLGPVIGHWNKKKQMTTNTCKRLTAYIQDVLDGEVGTKLGLGPTDILVPAKVNL
ncbi:mannosyltransferase putative-domain-containing protein [Xylariales sp. PMI_506]|nr:mannosyltransferase putative-domain-containing protein [Xylariales sp. PMI_506]